jgi:prepilin-type N-terminal cleavage/methylation domain-containing protein
MFDCSKARSIPEAGLSAALKRASVFSSGFTLLELLIAMALVALVTLIAATAFRVTVQAWERVSEEGESRQIQSALPVLLEKQLEARVSTRMFGKETVNPDSYFCGGENSLSFLTAYAPQGSPLQGVQQVQYLFDAGRKTLLVYLKSVTRLDDLGDATDGFQSKKTEEGFPVSQIHGITDFRLLYTDEPLFDTNDLKQWQTDWQCGMESVAVPSGLMLEMTIGEGSRARSLKWFYRIGGLQSAGPFGGR